MSNGDEEITRKSHIARIYKDDDPNSEQWIDIERLDELRFISKKQFPWREKRWTFDWDNFDPNGTDVDGNQIQKKQVADPKDDNNTIDVPIRTVILVTEGKEVQYQAYKHYFASDDSNSTRETYSRRIYHHDIPDGQLDDNKNPPRNPDDYLNALGAQDQDQYVETEIINKFWTNEHESRDEHGRLKPSTWQEKKWLLDVEGVDPLLHDPLLDSDVQSPDFIPRVNPSSGDGGEVAGSVIIDPPWRLDPLQNIVNVQFSRDGGIFVSGDKWGFGRYAKVTTKKGAQNWTGITNLATASVSADFESGQIVEGDIVASSYAVVGANKTTGAKGRPTFLLAGGTVHRVDFDANNPLEGHTIIMASHDGRNWSTVFDQSNILGEDGGGLSVNDLVWDKDANNGNGSFFARTFEGTTEGCYESTDGLSWGPGGGTFADHCKGKLSGKPDGFYGYDKVKDILIWPDQAGI